MVNLFYLLFKLQMGFLPGGTDTTIRHNTHHTHTKHSTQNYTSNKGHKMNTMQIKMNTMQI
jgi:hypothetical protein